MRSFLLKQLLPFVINQIRQGVSLKTVDDETGFYIKIKIVLIGREILNERIYLARDDSGYIKSNQNITL